MSGHLNKPPSVSSPENEYDSDSGSDIGIDRYLEVCIMSKSSDSSDLTDVEREEEEDDDDEGDEGDEGGEGGEEGEGEDVPMTMSKFVNVSPTTNYQKQSLHVFREMPGPKHVSDVSEKPIEYFWLFFTKSLFEKMVTETNRYAVQFLKSQQNLKPKSRARLWKPVTISEMQAFIAVLLEMGITKRPTIKSYWVQNSRNIPWFSKMFSRNRFQSLLKFFHLTDKETAILPEHPEYDPCVRFNFLVEHANTVFRQHYTPNKQLNIEEFLVGTHSEGATKQYRFNKKLYRRGIKFWMLCDSVTKYCLGFYYYPGAMSDEDKEEIKKKGLGYTVVEKLLSSGDYFNKGYHLYTDNFCTSVEIAKSLFQKGTYLTGTIRRSKKHVPKEVKTAIAGQPKYFSNNEILMCSYRGKESQKNPVILISTDGSMENITLTRKRHNNESIKTIPSMIHTYNQFIGGGDESDKMLYSNLDERRALKFWKKVVFNIFERMVMNAYILYKHNSAENKMGRIQFTSSIISDLEAIWWADKKFRDTPSTSTVNFGLEKLPGRNLRRCVVCSSKDNSAVKRSNLICSRCKKGVHGVCVGKHSC